MKGHVFDEIRLDPYGTVEEFINQIRERSKDLIDPKITEVYDWDEEYLIVAGYRPMNDRELAAEKKRKEAAKRAAATKKEKERVAELSELKRLREKYPDDAA